MLSPSLLEQVCRARGAKPNPALLQAMASEKANSLYAEYEISASADVMAAFMANVCHETGGLSLIRENPNYSAKNLMRVWGMYYGVGKKGRDGKPNRDTDGDGISDLAEQHGGNPVLVMSYNYNGRMGNRPGTTDGYDYRGGGPLQSTGRDNYQWLEKVTGLPFAANPKLIEDPEHWPLVACLTFTKKVGNLCTYAEGGNFEAVCKAINCGSPTSKIKVVGMEDREAWHRAWQKALANGACPASAPLGSKAIAYKVGSPNSDAISAIQKRLNALMYGEGKITVDGVFGVRTRSAVADFQMENGLEADGVVGPKTWEALFAPEAKCFPPPAAAQLGLAGLRAIGDPEIKKAENDRASAGVLALAAAPSLANNLGALDALKSAAETGGTAQSSIVTLVEILKFASANMLPIAAIFAAFLLWRRYGTVLYDRVERWSRPVGGA